MNRPNEVSTSDVTPAGTWEQDAPKRALDELFSLTSQYRTSEAYQQLLQFVTRFRSYSPFNAMLVHIQMPGAEFIAPPHNVAAQGSEVSRGHLLQDLLLQQPGVFHGFLPTLSFRCSYTVLGRLLLLATPTPSPLDGRVF